MLQIRNAAGLVLQLPSDQKLSVEINSTIFDTDDIIRGSFSYPFGFPLNENNCRFIENGHLPEVTINPDIKVTVTTGPHTFSALLSYTIEEDNADAALLIDLGAIADQVRNTSLREIVTEILLIDTMELPGKVTLLSLANAEPNTYPVVFPPFLNPKMIDPDFKPTANYRPVTISNYYYPGAGYAHSLAGQGDLLFVPMVYLCWLLTYICGKLGFGVQGSLFTNPELSRLILYNTQTTPGVSRDTGQFKVEVGRHLPDVPIADFMKSLRAYLGLSIDVDMSFRKITFNVYKEIKGRRNYLDVTKHVVPGTLGIERRGPGGFVVKTKIYSQDTSIKQELITPSFTIGTGEADVPLEIGTLRMAYGPSKKEGIASATIPAEDYNLIKEAEANSETSHWLIPYAVEAGNLADTYFAKAQNYCPYHDTREPDKTPPLVNDFGLRFLVYWGIKKDSIGQDYPYASSVSYDANYKVFASLSLQPGEPDDVWTRYQKHYYEFLTYSRSVSVVLRPPIALLSQINPSEVVGFQLKNLAFQRYIFEKLSYELPSESGYVLAKFEGRQSAPKLLRPNLPEEDLIIGHWIEIRLENQTDLVDGGQFDPTAIYQNNALRQVKADVVMYVWQTGFFTVPVPNSNVIVNVKLSKLSLDTQQQQIFHYEDDTVTALDARMVLHPNYLLKEARYINHMTPGGVERLWLLTREHTFNVMPGFGYRSR